MELLRLRFPAHGKTEVRSNRKLYVLRPLFTEGIEGVGPQFEDATRDLIEEVRRSFAGRRVSRETLESLLAGLVHPPIRTETFRLSFEAGKHGVSGPFFAAWFDRHGVRYVSLPALRHMFVARPGERGKYDMASEVERVLQALFREQRRQYGDGAPRPETFMAAQGEMVTEFETTVAIPPAPLPLQPDASMSGLMSILGGAEEFNGAAEIAAVSQDLNALHPDRLRRAVGADAVVERMRRILYEDAPVGTVLAGPPGVGKTTILHEAVARHLASLGPGASFHGVPRVWHLDPNRVIAGMSVVGMWQNRFEAILDFLKSPPKGRKRHDVLFVDNPVALLRVGKSSQNSLTLSDVLKPYVEKREFPLVLEATPEAWKRVQEMDRGFADLFQVVRVAEPPRDDAMRVILARRAELERRHECRVDGLAVVRILEHLASWRARRVLPGAAVEILQQLAVKHAGASIEPARVDEIFRAATTLHPAILDSRRALSEDEIRAAIDASLVGQPEAARALRETIHAVKARLGDPDRPLATLFFTGPTGVGKTEAAKALAKFLFGGADGLVRFDMNEFLDDDAVARLVGDAANPEGQLAGRVRYRPFCVLLFDEIEKAHPSVHDLLLQILGEGRLTDALGRVVDFTSAVVILTSNLGTSEAARTVGFGASDDAQAEVARKAVREFFRPEFVNRLDRVVCFRRLAVEDVRRIAVLQIGRLLERDGLVRRTASLHVSPRALDRIVKLGFDPEYGGRALKRSIEKELTALAAERLTAVPPDRAVLFEVHEVRGRLSPRIVPLETATRRFEPLTIEAPEDRPGLLDFHEWMLASVQECLDSVKDVPRDAAVMVYRDRLRELGRGLRETIADLRLPNVRAPYPTAARTKYLPEEGDDLRDLFARLDIHDYLEEVYRRAPVANHNVMPRFREAATLRFQRRALREVPREQTLLQLRALSPQGESCLRPLASAYAHLARSFDPHFEKFDEPVSRESLLYLSTDAPGLADFLRCEQGVHLFVEAFGPRAPVQVRVLSTPDDPARLAKSDLEAHAKWQQAYEEGSSEPDPWAPGELLRIYCRPSGSQEGTITDLRTGMMDRYRFDGASWFLWLYGAVPGEERLTP